MTRDHANLDDDGDDELSLKPALQSLWRYRRVILIGLVTVVIAYAGVMLLLYARMPKETLASLNFQLTFEGAERGEFPNGTKFAASEIVSTSVLTEVFRINDLQRYLTFQDFKEAMFILQANPDLELLSYEYQAKLADTRLTPVDRSRLEEEFQRKRESLKSTSFSLNFRRGERVLKVPASMLGKMLNDTLSTWARQAADRKGAVRYNVPVLSKHVLQKESLGADDQVVAVDSLRNTVDRILVTVSEIEQLPGSSAARIGEEKIGLADIRANLEDLLRFTIEPLLGLIRSTSTPAVSARAATYLSDRLQAVRITRDEAKQRLASLQDALRGYQHQRAPEQPPAGTEPGRGTSVTPQVSESFIDRLVQLSTQSTDIEYRQRLTDRIIKDGVLVADLTRQVDYYDALHKAFAAGRSGGSAADSGEVGRRAAQVAGEVSRLMNQVQAIYHQIAEQNLNPDTVLYTMTSPFVMRTASAMTLRTVVLYLVIVLLLASVILPLACLAHDYFRHWISPRPAAPAGPSASGSHHVAGV
jgi:hypothetical protein